MAKTKYEIIDLNNVEITVDVSMLIKTDDMFFNATEIAKQFDKQPNEFLRGETAKEYIKALIEVKSNTEKNRISESDLVKTRKGSKYGGTWLHQDLALQFGRWLSPLFSVKLDIWIKERLKEEESRKKSRLAAKTGYLELSEAVQNDHDPDKHYHYSNEANLINRIVLGMTSKEFKETHCVDNVRDNLTMFQTKAIEKLQRMNTSLIELGTEYQERKDKLTAYYNEKMCLPE